MMTRGIFLLLGVMLSGSAWAKPFDHRQVPAQTQWFLHADVEQFKKTQLGQFGQRQLEKLKAFLNPIELTLKFKLGADLSGVTLFGIGKDEAEVVLLLHGRFDRAQLTTLAEKAREHRAVEHRQHTIHSWEDPKGAHYGCLVAGHTLLLSDGLKTLRLALDVLDGKSPALEVPAIVAQTTKGPQPFFLLGLVDFAALGKLEAEGKILEKLQTLCFAVGEADNELVGRLLLQPRDPKTGQQIQRIVRGLVAFVEIAPAADDPGLAMLKKLVDKLKIELQEPYLTLNLKVPVKDILEAIQLQLTLGGGPGKNRLELGLGIGGKPKEKKE